MVQKRRSSKNYYEQEFQERVDILAVTVIMERSI